MEGARVTGRGNELIGVRLIRKMQIVTGHCPAAVEFWAEGAA